MSHYRISFLGAGRVAEALSREFISKGHIIGSVVSPGKKNGEWLAKQCNASWSPSPRFSDDSDIIIVAVPDRSLLQVMNTIRCSSNTIVAHTAGSFGLEVFPESIQNRGLFYPLQTFSKGRKIDFKDVPVFIEASNELTDKSLNDLAVSSGCKVYKEDSDHRRQLHVAAVFVSNFTNHMLTCGKEISSKAGYPFDILIPLIRETVLKAIENGPEKSQTGPAVRNDLNTIKKHLELLSFSPELKKMYDSVTESILHHYKDLKRNE